MKSEDRAAPQISVVILTPDRYQTIRKTIEHLRAQTARDWIELVVVAPSAKDLGADPSELEAFPWVRVVEVGPIDSTARARAEGIRAASAPVVVLAEDHSYPEPGWARALIDAHRQPWAAVGPVMGNANPSTAISWANLVIEYAPWLDPSRAGVVDHLPGHQSSYKRAILMEYGAELEAMLEAESVLHWDLRARGYQLYLEPAARVNHLNFSTPFSWLPLRFHGGRAFATARSRRWPLPRRLAYACGAPLIPLVRLRRLLGKLGRSRSRRGLLPRILPALVLGLALDGIGEMAGYAFGAGDAVRRLAVLEFERHRHLTAADRRRLDGDGRIP